MRHLTVCLTIAAVLAGTPVLADELSAPNSIEAWSLERIAELGREIYHHDIAAWVATDVLLEGTDGVPPPDLRGWIVTPQDDGLVVRFLRLDGEVLRPGWDVLVQNGVAGSLVVATDTVLSDEDQARFQARQTAIANLGALQCTSSFNSVVLEDPDGEGWLVWLLAATTEAGVIPVGGHYRFRLTADGRNIMMRDQLSNGCLNMRPEAEAVGIVVTHMLSDTPVETHVFLSLINGMALYVAAGDFIYAVEGDRISAVAPIPQ